MPFRDRTEAGRKLAAALAEYRERDPVVLALPRGGVPVGAEIAAAMGASLDLIMVRKIGAPGQPELAMGAVVDGAEALVVRNDDVIASAGVDEAEFAAACQRELAEIERRRRQFIGGRPPVEVSGRTAIVVDDGVATGATTRAALRAVRKRGPDLLVLAVPVAPTSSLAELRQEADDVVCLEDHELFGAIGMFYSDFRQLSDQEVIEMMARFGADRPAASER
jgi:putative phosphoribosyl transferase